MTTAEKKLLERRVLDFARQAGLPLPAGGPLEREEPDFQIATPRGLVGIELTHIHPPPRNKSFPSPMAEAALYRKAVRRAEKMYAQTPATFPVKVTAYPWNIERKRGNEKAMARELVDYVRANAHKANPVFTCDRRQELPLGFGVVSIAADTKPWFAGSAVTVSLEDIYEELERRIAEKNARLPIYREHLPQAQVWLLLYSGADVTNGIELPYGFDKWAVATGFDRVFFCSGLTNGVYEIQVAT